MFNFTKAETNAVLFVVIILLVSGIYQLISPSKSLQPFYDYSSSDSTFKRLSQDKFTTNNNTSFIASDKSKLTKSQKITIKSTNKKEKLLPASINLNAATERDLQKLPRIGPAKAKLIIEYRIKNRNFENIEELLEIKGIGKKTLEKLKPYIIIK